MQNNPRDERHQARLLASLDRRIKALETAPRAGHTSISNGKFLVLDPATGAVIASLAGTAGTDLAGNPLPAGLAAEVGAVNGGVVKPGTIDASKVSFVARDISGVTTTTSATAPVSPVVGDLWIDTGHGNLLQRWDGAAWVSLPVGTDGIAAQAVTASQIAANTITSAQIAAGAITAATIAAGAIDGQTISGATIQTVTSDGGFFAYSGPPTLGNLIVSIASMAGTDDYGNAYPQGLDVNAGAISGSLITIEPGAGNGVFVYATIPQVTMFSAGSGTWVCPAGVTSVKVEAWGGGGGGGDYESSLPSAGSGGSGGEYAAEPALTVTPGNSYPYAVGSGGAAGTGGGTGVQGGDTTFGGTSVVAHGGHFGSWTGASFPGGTGSTNTTHNNGGAGGTSATAQNVAGGGGGGSGGYATAGNAGQNASGTTAGAGAVAVAGGGPGGNGGTSAKAATAAVAPGGGGGGAGSQGIAGAGANGRVTITYTPARTLLASIAGASGTDPYGNAYPAGIGATSLALGGVDVTGAWQTFTPTWTASTPPTLGNGSLTGRYMLIGKTCHVTINLVIGSTTTLGSGNYLFGVPFTSSSSGSGNYLGTARLTAAANWIGQVTLGTGSAVMNATFATNSTTTTATNMSASVPVAPASGNILTMSLTYQIA